MLAKIIYLLIAFVAYHSAYASPTSDNKIPDRAAGILDNLLPRRELNPNLLAVNSFLNDGRFGSIEAQLSEIKNTLGLKHIRILINWDNNVQPTPDAIPNFAFYDEIISKIPSGVVATAVVTGLPSWMENSANWLGGNPRNTFVRRWLTKVAKRYARKSKLRAIQVWNEPNDTANPHNVILGVSDSASNYLALLKQARPIIRKYGNKKILNAATTSIAQNYPSSLNYNKALQAAEVEKYVDYFAIHYYGSSYERLFFSGGIVEFLKSLRKPIWITESGKQGVLEQLEYAERTWPLLKELVPSIQRIFIYQFTDSLAADDTWGLKTLDPNFPISDLYLWLRDR